MVQNIKSQNRILFFVFFLSLIFYFVYLFLFHFFSFSVLLFLFSFFFVPLNSSFFAYIIFLKRKLAGNGKNDIIRQVKRHFVLRWEGNSETTKLLCHKDPKVEE